MKGGFSNLMKQAQDIQANFQKAQEEIANLEIIGESGGGMIKVTMTGKHDVKKVLIDDDLIGDDKEMLEDLLAAAINDAVHKVDNVTREKMTNELGIPLPAGMKLPF